MLMVAAVGALLLGIGFFFSKGAQIANAKADEVNVRSEDLSKYNKVIDGLNKEIASIDNDQQPYVDSVRHRVYWVRVFNYLSQKMQNDILYLTVLEPLAAGRPIISDGATELIAAAPDAEAIVDAFSIQGLWRENPRGSEVVYDFFKGLKGDADAGEVSFFDLKEVDISEVSEVDAGTNDDRYAYPFKMTLPLPAENQVKFTK